MKIEITKETVHGWYCVHINGKRGRKFKNAVGLDIPKETVDRWMMAIDEFFVVNEEMREIYEKGGP